MNRSTANECEFQFLHKVRERDVAKLRNETSLLGKYIAYALSHTLKPESECVCATHFLPLSHALTLFKCEAVFNRGTTHLSHLNHKTKKKKKQMQRLESKQKLCLSWPR